MKNKREEGSVTLFVTVTCFFVIIMLITFVMNLENKKQAQNREINQITKSYEVKEQEMEEIYSQIIDENQ